MIRHRVRSPALMAVLTVGLIVGGLLVGYEPVGGDPDRLYRPIKSELARSLHDGALPLWSDRFGLGVPLVAESHVAAFYPPNRLLYRFLDVSTAYRLAMWLHYVALAAATYAYARRLELSPWGAALAAVAFTLCGFQAIHSSHEPFYSALPFLLLALCFTEEYVATGRSVWLALLALTWGTQLTLGHFQIQMWTAVLVLITGCWRVVQSGSRLRALGLIGGLAAGAGTAAIQIVPTWELARLVGSNRRSLYDLMFFSFPPAHWAELAIPRLFHGLRGGPGDAYWFTQATTSFETCLYVGTVPLILAFIGLASPRSRMLAAWQFIVPASFALATMPRWWPSGYAAILSVPVLGYFRAPSRYTAITSLGLALLAGRGFDRTISTRRFAIGLIAAVIFAAAAVLWAVYWAQLPAYRAALGDGDLGRFVALAARVWIISIVAILAWRNRLVAPAVPFLLTAAELGVLYYHSTTEWGRSIELPDSSPVLQRLAEESDVGTVAGDVHDLPVRANRSPAYPYLGMNLLPPNDALDLAGSQSLAGDPVTLGLLRHFRVTHGIWNRPVPGTDVLYSGADYALDRVVSREPGLPEHSTWYLVRYLNVLPQVHVARKTLDAPDLKTVFAQLATTDSDDSAFFLPGDRPEDVGARARSARVVAWDGLHGEIEHDGVCDVVIRRTYAPGWVARVDGGAEIPVLRVDGGLQGVRLSGAGRTRIELRYRPPHWPLVVAISLLSLGMVVLILLLGTRGETLRRLVRRHSVG